MTRRGYTLFEVVLVMAIMVFIGAMVSPLVFDGLHSEGKVTAASDMVRARWADCRTQAIEEGRPYRFAVIPNTGKFKVEVFDPSTMSNGQASGPNNGQAAGSNNAQTVTPFMDGTAASPRDDPGMVIEGTLPSGVRFGTKDTPVNADNEEPTDGDYVTIAVFLPDGTAQDDVEITFGSKGTSTVTLKLRALTGTSTQSRPTEEAK